MLTRSANTESSECQRARDRKSMFVSLKSSVSFSDLELRHPGLPPHLENRKMARETNTAVNTFGNRPITRVTANPSDRSGAEDKQEGARHDGGDMRIQIVAKARSKPEEIALALPSLPSVSSLMRSKIRNVGIYRHADREHQAGDARQRPRSLDVA